MRLLYHKREEKKRIFQTTLEVVKLDIPVRKFGRRACSDAVYEMYFTPTMAYYFASSCG